MINQYHDFRFLLSLIISFGTFNQSVTIEVLLEWLLLMPILISFFDLLL